MSDKVAKQDWYDCETEWTVKGFVKVLQNRIKMVVKQKWTVERLMNGMSGGRENNGKRFGIQGWGARKPGWGGGKQTRVRGLREWEGWKTVARRLRTWVRRLDQQWESWKRGMWWLENKCATVAKKGRRLQNILEKEEWDDWKTGCDSCQKGMRVAKKRWKEGWDDWKTVVQRLPKRDEGCKTVLEKWDEMFGKEGATVA